MDNLNKYLTDVFRNCENFNKPFLLIKKDYLYSKYSYKQTWELILKTITLFRQNGLKQGDKILIWGPNNPEWSV